MYIFSARLIMKTFKELVSIKRYIDWLISKKGSITLLPFDIIENHIIDKLEWFCIIRFLFAILPFYRHETNFLKILRYNFLLGDVYQKINTLPLTLMNHNHPYYYEAYVVFEWSPFSRKHPINYTVAIIKSANEYPFHSIDFKYRNIEKLVSKQVDKKQMQARLSIHLNFNHSYGTYIYIPNCVHYSRRKLSFHTIPFSIQLCDAYNSIYDVYNEMLSLNIIEQHIRSC